MSEQRFDQYLKDKLDKHDSFVPPHVWSNIHKQVRPNRRLWYIPLMLLATGLITAVVLLLPSDQLKADRQQNNAIEDRSYMNPGNEQQLAGQISTQSANATKSDLQANDAGNFRNLESQQSAALQKSSPPSARQMDKASRVTNGKGKTQSTQNTGDQLRQAQGGFAHVETVESQSNESDPSAENLDVKSIGAEVFNDAAGSSDTPISSTGQASSSDNAASELINVSGTAGKASQNNTSADQEQTTNATESASSLDIAEKDQIAERNRLNPAVEMLGTLRRGQSLAYGQLVYDPCMVKGGKKKNRVHCFSFISQREQIFADLGLGPQYAHQLLTTRNFESESLRTNRANSESYLLAYNVSARLGLKMANGITGTTGISFDRFHERFEYYDPNQIRTTITNVIIDTIFSNGNITYVWDTLSIQTRGERTVKHTNALTFINIPVTLGYTWEMEKFNLGVQGGMALNLLFTKGGRIVQPDGEVGSLNGDGHKSVYKTSAGVSVLSSVVLEYKIENDLSVFVEPRFAYQLTNLTRDDYLLDQNYWTGGVNFGIRKILSEKITRKKKYGVN